MFKQRYKRLNDSVSPNPELVNMVKNLDKTKQKNNIFNRALLKPAIALMTIIITYCSVPVLAANIPAIYDLMYLVSPTVAQHFMPIQKSCESNGIEMEVVSAYIKENKAQVYITLKDLEGNRVDETTNLNDSYNINRAFDCTIGNCENIGYDEKSKKATFLITIINSENKNIIGEKLTFEMSDFVSQKEEWNGVKLPITLEQIESDIEKQKVRIAGFSTTNNQYENMYDKDEEIVIKPNKDIEFGVTDMTITGIAYFDNKLHIQVSAKNNLKIDNHGEIYLKNNETNEKKMIAYKLHFILGKNGDKYEYSSDYYRADNPNRIDFTEYVFDISQEELKNYTIYGDFIVSGLNTEGDWKVTFPLEVEQNNTITIKNKSLDNINRLFEFVENTKVDSLNRIEDEIRVITYTIEGEPIIKDIRFVMNDEETFYEITTDNKGDKFEEVQVKTKKYNANLYTIAATNNNEVSEVCLIRIT